MIRIGFAYENYSPFSDATQLRPCQFWMLIVRVTSATRCVLVLSREVSMYCRFPLHLGLRSQLHLSNQFYFNTLVPITSFKSS